MSTQEKPRDRVMALPEELRKELLYLAHLDPEKQKSTLFHNVAVSGERIQALIDSAKREVLEQIRPPQAIIDSMKLTQPHKYRGVEYPCCSICGFCPEAINAFIDSQLEQSEESNV